MLVGDDWNVLVEIPGRYLVEVVSVVVRQHDEVERRQLVDGHRRLHQPPGPQPVAQLGVVTLVEEVRVGEEGEAGVAHEDRGVAYELQLAGVELRILASRQVKRFRHG